MKLVFCWNQISTLSINVVPVQQVLLSMTNLHSWVLWNDSVLFMLLYSVYCEIFIYPSDQHIICFYLSVHHLVLRLSLLFSLISLSQIVLCCQIDREHKYGSECWNLLVGSYKIVFQVIQIMLVMCLKWKHKIKLGARWSLWVYLQVWEPQLIQPVTILNCWFVLLLDSATGGKVDLIWFCHIPLLAAGSHDHPSMWRAD